MNSRLASCCLLGCLPTLKDVDNLGGLNIMCEVTIVGQLLSVFDNSRSACS
ncbi:hypothetical protein BDK88_3726 [Natrinema hispanicum]|uniref:Uncharacterized protein n=1 Tax=Natrinema hispanicum TaxID=392421 RepID=A0A1I0JKT4_9EURY|nr:hypothetical protein [Natrinema hispanicum]RZV06493.1 hypothetical protein BDK88_3503 [Natrinema hispanicum]RZV06697.1 hypothetical protein BDK88_3726 [Natrinema hispanicum]SEU10254.1 hypothetical protein SAMN04488694_14516 [Natrinema hispanicum]